MYICRFVKPFKLCSVYFFGCLWLLTDLILLPLIRSWVAGEAAKAEKPRLLWLYLIPPACPVGSQGVPRPVRDLVSPACLSLPPNMNKLWIPLPGQIQGACGKSVQATWASTPLYVEDQRLYSELLPGDQVPHSIPKPSHLSMKTHFGFLFRSLSQSRSFGLHPQLVTKCEGRNKDWSVNQEPRLTAQLLLHQDGPIPLSNWRSVFFSLWTKSQVT